MVWEAFNKALEKDDTILNRIMGIGSPSKAWRGSSTIGEGGDTTIPSPGRSPKQSLPGIGLHNPLHVW